MLVEERHPLRRSCQFGRPIFDVKIQKWLPLLLRVSNRRKWPAALSRERSQTASKCRAIGRDVHLIGLFRLMSCLSPIPSEFYFELCLDGSKDAD